MALDSLSVSIDPGITGLVGSNGAGKSTLVKILLGLVAPSGGSASVMGNDVVRDQRAIRALVGYMPENDCLPPDTNAAQFVGFMARCSGLPDGAARERAAEVLRHVGLFEERYRPVGSYSTGMAQRVKLAQALVHDPAILILDEPTNGLDPAGRDEMLALVQRTYREFGMSVLVSSHLLGELEKVCDSILLIEQGRLVRFERLDAFTADTGTLIVEIDGDSASFEAMLLEAGLTLRHDNNCAVIAVPPGGDNLDTVCDIVRDAAVTTGAGILRLERNRARLGDVFAGAVNA